MNKQLKTTLKILGYGALSLNVTLLSLYIWRRREEKRRQLEKLTDNKIPEPGEISVPAYKIELPETNPEPETEEDKKSRVRSDYAKTLIDSIRLQRFRSREELFQSSMFSYQASGCKALDDLKYCPKTVDEMEEFIESVGIRSEYERLLETMYSPYHDWD